MTRQIALPGPARPWAVAIAAAALMSLAACKGDDAPLTPAGAALVASAPAVAATKVPPPPAIPSAVATPAASDGMAAGGDLAGAEAQLDGVLTKASACTADAECRSVAVGAKACGGPTGYRAYSARTASPDSVEALARHERELAAAQAKASHQVSPCFMLADPGARCQQNRCVTGRTGP